MPIKIVTRGDPGESVLWPLRNQINRNMNVRRLLPEVGDAGQLRRGGSITGIIGGPPPSRGVVVSPVPPVPPVVVSPPVVVPPVVVPPEVVLPPVVQPGGWPMPQPSYSIGAGVPINISMEVAINDVQGVQIGPIQGPLLVQGWLIHSLGGEITNPQWDLWRIDFSPVSGIRTATFNDNGIPLDLDSDGLSLYANGVLQDQSSAVVPFVSRGWFRKLTSASTFEPYGWMSCRLVVPFQSVFIKWYSQNDSAGARQENLWLDCVQLTGDVGMVPIVPRLRCPTGQHQHGQETYCRH